MRFLPIATIILHLLFIFHNPIASGHKPNLPIPFDPAFDDEATEERYNSNTNPCLNEDVHLHLESESSSHHEDDCVHVDFTEGEVQEFIPLELSDHLAALAGKFTRRIYPPRPNPIKALKRYAELPYVIPVGPSLFFCSLFLVLLSWYLRRILVSALRRTARKLDLFPEHQEFPRLSLYSLQQSKREARLRTEARNTWAWMAKKYILMQNDSNVNVGVFRTTWSDFDLAKDVWGIVRTMLKASAWMTQTKERLKKTAKNALQKKKAEDPQKSDNKEKAHFKKDSDSTRHRSEWSVKKDEVNRMSMWLEHLETAGKSTSGKEKVRKSGVEQFSSKFKSKTAPVARMANVISKVDITGSTDKKKQPPQPEKIIEEKDLVKLISQKREQSKGDKDDGVYVLVEVRDEAVEVGGPPEDKQSTTTTTK